MEGLLGNFLTRFASKGHGRKGSAPPLLTELLQEAEGETVETTREGVFEYRVKRDGDLLLYEVFPVLDGRELMRMRRTVLSISEGLDPDEVEPLSFSRLVEVLGQAAASQLAPLPDLERVRELSMLAAFEAVGMPTIYALSRDPAVSEFFLDSPTSSVYLDHSRRGRCESRIFLTERERRALETHMDTFKGYTLDFANPSLKNEFEIFGARLRISLDLSPLAVSSFSLDVRKLGSAGMSLPELIRLKSITLEAASFLVASLELGLNVTIIGETGTGKTTLLNALDEAVNPRLRRVYVEDAVETKDMLERGYHQMKLKVDPFERSRKAARTKSAEITKILHRSPDLVILGEIQSEEHSRAFFHALSAGVRGMQTFHASSPEQAIRRWLEIHRVAKSNLQDLDLIVQMSRRERLAAPREVKSISMLTEEAGEPRLREVYVRGREGELMRIIPWERLQLKRSLTVEALLKEATRMQAGSGIGALAVDRT